MYQSVDDSNMTVNDDSATRLDNPDNLQMRMGFRTRSLADNRLRFIKQLGVEDIFVDRVGTDEGPKVFLDREVDDASTLTIDNNYIPSVEELVQAKCSFNPQPARLCSPSA